MIPLLATLLSPQAEAFCGFYVSGADTSLYNDATMVVLMRSGTRTVLSMQNNYQGPPSAFAMVVPVPQVLQKDNVKTLPRDVFARVDALASPRLVAYWEQDPCHQPEPVEMSEDLAAIGYAVDEEAPADDADLGVKIEAQFQVGEYDIVVLSASDSAGLDTWLRRESYTIPDGADEVLKPYVAAGTKFFVAKVDPQRVTFEGDRAVLSPLRMHYDSQTFDLPVRLGLLNAKGPQDLIVHVLAPGQRYDVANYDNAFVPTNLRVTPEVEGRFGGFYEALFTEVAKPRTVVTEYSWDAASCDPCPQPPLTSSELLTLGSDVTGSAAYVLTRLHYRYEADGLDSDLVFEAAPPVRGGQGTPKPDGTFADTGAHSSSVNTFQGRYAILHEWEGAIACDDPVRGRWGGPPSGTSEVATARSSLTTGGKAEAAPKLASLLRDSVPGVVEAAPPAEEPAETPEAAPPSRGMCSTGGATGALWLLAVLPWLSRRR